MPPQAAGSGARRARSVLRDTCQLCEDRVAGRLGINEGPDVFRREAALLATDQELAKCSDIFGGRIELSDREALNGKVLADPDKECPARAGTHGASRR